MNNKYVYMIVAAIVATIAYFVGTHDLFAAEGGGLSDRWWFAMILAVGLGAGGTGGSDVVSILVEGITGYINTMILFVIFGVIIHLAISMGLNGAAFDAMGTVMAGVTYAVSGLFTNLVLSYLRKAN